MPKPLSILIAEDDKALRLMLGRVLESASHRVVYAENGQEALQALEREPIDLIVTDVLMPAKGGLEFIEEVHRKRPFLPIVAISGGGTHAVDKPHYLNVAKILGATVSQPKPFTPEEILSAIDRAWTETRPPPPRLPADELPRHAG